MHSIIERHTKIALQFSGGKDSLACLFLLRPYWDKLTVFWVNTSAVFPETLDIMNQVRAMVPHFIEIKSNALEDVEYNGFPVDILPETRTGFGRLVDGHTKPVMRLSSICCATNIWAPMLEAMKTFGATLIIRGQRVSETRKSPVKSGDVIDGVEYLFPIESWSAESVRGFLGDRLPSHYRYTETSLDCWHCTAYLFENLGKWKYMREFHPEKLVHVRAKLFDLRSAVRRESAIIDEVHEAMKEESVLCGVV